MPPSSSSKKKKGGKLKKPKPKTSNEEEERKLAEAFKTSSLLGEQIGSFFENAEAQGDDAPPLPDNPPCDGCLKPFAGTMQCAQCQSVFYCCRDCQVSHWISKHKFECAELKQQNEETAKRVLQSFKTMRGWKDLDVAGAYKAAVHQGLHDQIRSVLELDMELPDCIAERYRDGCEYFCYTHCVMTFLFRGQRAEGKAQRLTSSFNCMDGLRIKGYVRSHPDALDTWLQASVQLLRAVTDQTLLQKPEEHYIVCEIVLDVWRMWSSVFNSSTGSRAILTPFPSSDNSSGEEVGTADQKRRSSEDHARRIVTTLRDAIRPFLLVSHTRTQFEFLQATVFEVAATVQVRIQEYRIGINVVSILDLNGKFKFLFQHIAVPDAERELATGRHLNAQEATAGMARVFQRLGLQGAP
jgi:MYND finger